MIPGFSRSIELSWFEPGIFDWLAGDRWVIAADCRGHGKSDKPSGEAAYGRVMADDIARLLGHLNSCDPFRPEVETLKTALKTSFTKCANSGEKMIVARAL